MNQIIVIITFKRIVVSLGVVILKYFRSQIPQICLLSYIFISCSCGNTIAIRSLKDYFKNSLGIKRA